MRSHELDDPTQLMTDIVTAGADGLVERAAEWNITIPPDMVRRAAELALGLREVDPDIRPSRSLSATTE